MAAETIEGALAGRPAPFSWQVMLNGHPATPGELRGFIEVRPVLDFNALEPGKAATDAIRKSAGDLQLAQRYGARVRLTAGWHCERTRTRDVGDRHDLLLDEDHGALDLTLEVRIPGSRVAVEVCLEARMVLVAPGLDTPP